MDQDSTKGTDKRNWRERLGIGTGSAIATTRELPKISETYAAVPRAEQQAAVTRAPAAPRVVATKPAVKPAPMAPRPAPRVAAPALAEPEKLAEKLRAQREASARLAEQRVHVAKQRAEAVVAPVKANGTAPHANGAASPKPKFTFAEDDKQVATAPAVTTGFTRAPQPQMPPGRPPLGGLTSPPLPPSYTPRPPVQQPQAPPPVNPYVAQSAPRPQVAVPPQYQPQPMPGYRPVDPVNGYPPMPQSPFPPQRPFQPQGFGAPQQTGPRLNMPQRPVMNPGYPPVPSTPPDFGAAPVGGADPRLNPSRFGRTPFTPRTPAPPPQPHFDNAEAPEQYFEEAPPPRTARRQAADYQQAYRDMETGFEDEPQRSSGPWILLALLLLALAIAGASVWYYQQSIKPLMTGNQATQEQQVPVVDAPVQPAKIEPEPVQTPVQGATSKKRIYDRIVGDQEILGGDIVPSEETPLAPDVNATEALGDSQVPAESVGEGVGGDAMPLPIPPPPGDGNTQGSLETEDPAKTSAEIETPAAGASQAAVAAPTPSEVIEPAAAQSDSGAPADPAPAKVVETLTGDDAVLLPKIEKNKAVAAKPKKAAPSKVAAKTLGAKPVVLVPPTKSAVKKSAKPRVVPDEVALAPEPVDGTVDIYRDVSPEAGPVVPKAAPKPTTPTKKRTLADLFSKDDTANEAAVDSFQPVPDETPVQAKKQAPAAKPAPQPVQVAQAGGFVAQLASFRSRDEASSEFNRLKSRNASVFNGASAVISEAQVAGTTRYRLSVGGMASRDEATAFCTRLFAAGERDCLVRRQ